MKNRALLVAVFALLVGLVSAAPVAAQLPTVTANILDGVSLTPPNRTVIVTIGTSDRELIFGNACADGIPH